MQFQNCIFDLYGTLVDIHTEEGKPELWQAMAAEYAKLGAVYAPVQLRKAYAALVQAEEQRLKTLHPGETDYCPEIQLENVFGGLFAQKSVMVTDAEIQRIGHLFRQRSTEYIRLYDGVPEMLSALRKQGKGVWLLSNAQHMFTAWELETLGLTDFFDGIYLSSDWGSKKPDSRFFRSLLEEHGIEPATAIMVGNDGVCDIAGAKAVGLHTLYIRSNLTPKEPTPAADYSLPEMDIATVQQILLG